jgi:hypothetical protein
MPSVVKALTGKKTKKITSKKKTKVYSWWLHCHKNSCIKGEQKLQHSQIKNKIGLPMNDENSGI